MPQYENYAPYTISVDSVESINALFRKVYQFMAMGLILTALAAYLTASSPTMLGLLYTSRAPMLIIAVAEIGLVLWLSAGLNKLSASAARNITVFCAQVSCSYTQASLSLRPSCPLRECSEL